MSKKIVGVLAALAALSAGAEAVAYTTNAVYVSSPELVQRACSASPAVHYAFCTGGGGEVGDFKLVGCDVQKLETWLVGIETNRLHAKIDPKDLPAQFSPIPASVTKLPENLSKFYIIDTEQPDSWGSPGKVCTPSGAVIFKKQGG